MAEITSYAYMKIRDLLEDMIQYIELRDDTGTKIIRIPVSDTRVTHNYDRTAQEQTYTILIKGSDSDISLPTIFGSVAFFETETGTNAIAIETTTLFQLYAEADELTITCKLQIPEVV